VPAHVTVLYPFVTPESLDDAHVRRLTRLFDDVAPFDFVLRRIGWFGEKVVYLAPEPAAPFVALTEGVVREFPQHAPYGGAFDEIVPHLTIGDRGPVAELRSAADAVAPALPIRGRATEVWLMVGSSAPGAWRVHTRFALGGRA
jgi:2'-5' RNA ligase